MRNVFENPFRPGAGHKPPYLAGRTLEQDEVRAFLKQKNIFAILFFDRLGTF